MKKISLLIISLFAYIAFQAQTINIVDQNSLQPIAKVEVYNQYENKLLGETDDLGNFSLPDLDSNVYLGFKHPLYTQEIFTVGELAKMENKIRMIENIYSIDEVVVSASKFEEKKKDVAQKVQVIRASELRYMNQTSMADVMINSGNVFVQKSQLGGGSPIIRGFETNKVLMVVDGVRMNNAIYRGGHLQNIVTLDNSIMERTEIVFGAGSVVYGSDALGGVMSFTTKNPTLSSNDNLKVKAGAYTRYMSSVAGYAGHADVSIGTKKLGSLTSFTYSNYDDLKQGAKRNPFYGNFGARTWYQERFNGVDTMLKNPDTNIQIGSGYRQYDVLQKFMFQQNEFTRHLINIQYSTSSNVDRYDRLAQLKGNKPKYAEWYYGPQQRLLTSYSLTNNKVNRFYNHSRLILAYQNIVESRNTRKFGDNLLGHRTEEINIGSLNLDFDKSVGKNEIRYGAEFYYNDVKSSAFEEDIVADTTGPLDTRYPNGGSQMSSGAIYATHTLEIKKNQLILNDGIRFTYVGLNAKFNDQSYFPFPFNSISQTNKALNGNLGLVYMPGANWRFVINGSTGFRAPNVDDLSKVFESIPGSVIVPNPSIKPEYTYNGELGISKTFLKQVTASVTGYYTFYTNALTVDAGQFNGSDSVLYDGQMSKVITTINKGKAYIYGVEGSVQGHLNKYFSMLGTVNYTYGRIKTDSTDYPLDHIPPVFGKFSFITTTNNFKAEFFVNYSGWKNLKDYNLVGEDNFSSATIYGMPAWCTINARLGYQFNKTVNLQIACENILDQNYRNYASNISAPGRNFVITLRGNF